MKKEKENNLGVIFGIISIFAWIIPLFGYPITILGIIYSSKELKNSNKKAKIGLILSIVFLIITIANSVLGVIMAYNDSKLDSTDIEEETNIVETTTTSVIETTTTVAIDNNSINESSNNEITEKNVLPEDTTNDYNLYKSVINEYSNAINDNNRQDDGKSKYPNISWNVAVNNYRNNSNTNYKNNSYYTYYDIDKDGTNELIYLYYNGVECIHKYINGTIYKFDVLENTSYVGYVTIYSNGYIYTWDRMNAATYIHSIYTLSGNKLKNIDSICEFYENGTTKNYYKCTNESSESDLNDSTKVDYTIDKYLSNTSKVDIDSLPKYKIN